MKKLLIGIQTFADLVDPVENYVYVDKTKVLQTLIQSGKYYFLSRPRRFGKSVLVSTLGELFAANKQLFKGLYIEDKWDWNMTHPVIEISFGSGSNDTEKHFNQAIYTNLKRNQRRLNIACEDDKESYNLIPERRISPILNGRGYNHE